MAHDLLIARLIERVADPGRAADQDGLRATRPDGYPTVPGQFVERAEKQLGFALPPLQRRLYLEVGDGAFGPGSGITGVGPAWGESTSALVDGYRSRVQAPAGEMEDWLFQMELTYDIDAARLRAAGEWPERLLPLAAGTGVTHCIDCARPEGPVIDFSDLDWRHGAAWESLFKAASPSLAQWLEAWLEGRLGRPHPEAPVRA